VKVILPLAGLGSRVRPHTYTRPKPLISVAGNTVLGHVLDGLAGLPIDEVIFIVGHLGNQIEEYVRPRYAFQTRYIEQTELRGQAHALDLAAEFIDQPVLIIFVNTIVNTDLTRLLETQDDGVLYVKEVEDPRRFGVAVLDHGVVTRLVEKPQTPVSNLAVIGYYYLRNWQLLRTALHDVIEKGIQTGGEYYLADALQLMIEAGARFQAWTVDMWEDCGTIEALLHTNRVLLDHGHERKPQQMEHSVIIPPVNIGSGTQIRASVVGPHVSIGEGATVTGATIADSIIGDGTTITDISLRGSVIGSKVTVRGVAHRLNVGDTSAVELA